MILTMRTNEKKARERPRASLFLLGLGFRQQLLYLFPGLFLALRTIDDQYTKSISRYFGSGQLSSETFFSMESTTTRRSAIAARISS